MSVNIARTLVPNIDIKQIPTPAFLVVGSSPSEDKKGRTYYDNPRFYLYDMSDVPPETNISRYIKSNFSESPSNFQLSGIFKKKFDVVILDNAVGKFLDGKVGPLIYMFNMVKPGGTFIIDSVNGLSLIQPEEEESFENAKERVKKEFIDHLKSISNQGSIEITTFGELIGKNPVANEVYGPLLANHMFVEQKYIRPEGECIVITKVSSGGRRTTRRKHAKSRKSKMRYKYKGIK